MERKWNKLRRRAGPESKFLWMDTERYLQMKSAAERVVSGEWDLGQYENFLNSMEAVLSQKESEIKAIEIPMEMIEELQDELEAAFAGIDCYNDGLDEMRLYLTDTNPSHLEDGLALIREGNELIHGSFRKEISHPEGKL